MEKAHISLDDPCVAHQAILFMLDVLMRSNKPALTLEELYDSFGDKSFTPQMLRAVGGNEQGLKLFLLKYPSLFTLNNDLISANSGGAGPMNRLNTTPDRYLRKSKSNKAANSSTIILLNGDSSNNNNDSNPTVNSPDGSSSSGGGGCDLSLSVLSDGQSGNGEYQPLTLSKTMKEIEQEAIAFFRKQMTKREEDWLQIVSVAGHASQSSSDIRKFVGPQNEFKSFLLKYPHIFFVRDEYCGLKGRADVSTQPFPPPSPPPRRRLPPSLIPTGTNGSQVNIGGVLTRNHSFKTNSTNRYSACANLMPNTPNGSLPAQPLPPPSSLNLMNSASMMMNSYNNSTPSLASPIMNSISSASISTNGAGNSKSRLTPLEVKAVHYVMRILHKNGRMLLQTIPGLISRAPDPVSNVVGFTREDLIQFFKRHSAIFQLHPDGCVTVKNDAVQALIIKENKGTPTAIGVAGTGVNTQNGGVNANDNNQTVTDNSGIISNSGVILRIFPKYGILNMDNNEQVFFDIQSCQFETFSDLTTILHISDRLYFNAIIGPRDGSTKWRSIKTWIKMRPQHNQHQQSSPLDNMSTHSDADKSDDSASNASSSHFNMIKSSSQHVNINNSAYLMNHNTFTPTGNQRTIKFTPNLSSAEYNPVNFAISDNSNHIDSGAPVPSSLSPSSNQFFDDSGASIPSTPTTILAVNNGQNGTGTGEFNQYLIESSVGGCDSQFQQQSQTSATLLNGVIEETGLEVLNELSQAATSVNRPNSFAATKHIYEVNQVIENGVAKVVVDMAPSSAVVAPTPTPTPPVTATATTKFIKQSTDNISQREVTSSTSVSQGCQTISTGDITVTAICIDT